MEKDWGARFTDRPARRDLNRRTLLVAGGYWTFTIVLFLIMLGAGVDMIGPGALPIVAVTLPSSMLMIMAHPGLPTDPDRPDYVPLASSLGTFVLGPLISGGLNAVAIYWLVSVIQRRRHRKTSD